MSKSGPQRENQPNRPIVDDATRFLTGQEADDNLEFDLAEGTSGSGPLGVIGEYLLLEPLGAGGMGRVYRAEHRTMNRQVALKVLSPEFASRPDLLQQFFQEIRTIARLMHPNIVTAFDAGSFEGRHYLVMELVEGELLSERVRREGPLSSGEAVSVLRQVADALAYAHRMGIIHRDIKPGNIMLTREGVVKILDFGLAKFSASARKQTGQRLFMGTPEYMSPEQVRDPEHLDARSDLYSLGATLFFILCGRPMFTGDKMAVARAHVNQKPPPLFVACRDVDLRLDAVFQKLVAKDPKDRYGSAEELLSSLNDMNLAADSLNTAERLPQVLGGHLDTSTSVISHRSTATSAMHVVAIDLGVLTSAAAYYDPVIGPKLIDAGDGAAHRFRNMIWSDGTRVRYGAAAAEKRQTAPDQVVHSIQRWIGLRELARPFRGRRVPPEVLLSAMLRHIMKRASEFLDVPVSTAVVTVPGCYDQLHRRSIRTATRIAGISLIQLIDKPVAAALNWLEVQQRLAPLKQNRNKTLLYVQLDASAMEAAVLDCQHGGVVERSVSGDWRLGLQRWQARLSELLIGKLRNLTRRSIREDVAAAARLQRTVELALDRIIQSGKVEIRFQWGDVTLHEVVTADQFLGLCQDLMQELVHCIQEVLKLAAVSPDKLCAVILNGRMLQMKQVAKLVRQLVPRSVESVTCDETELARGAAIQAHYASRLELDQSDLLHGVGCTPYDFAVLASRLPKSKPRIVLPRGTQVPTSVSKTLRMPVSNSDSSDDLTVQFLESTRVGNRDWRRLGLVNIHEEFDQFHPDDPLQLRVEVDESGIVESSLIWPRGNRQAHLTSLTGNELAPDQIKFWKHWLEDMELCAE